MEFYVLRLAQGSTISSTITNSATAKCYIRAASSVPLNHKELDPLLVTRVLEFQCIKDVLSEFKRWESMPNCREPFTVKMVLSMHKKHKNKHPEILDSVSCD